MAQSGLKMDSSTLKYLIELSGCCLIEFTMFYLERDFELYTRLQFGMN